MSEQRAAMELCKDLGSITKELEMLRDQVKELKEDRDSWRRVAEKLQIAINWSPQMPAPWPPKPLCSCPPGTVCLNAACPHRATVTCQVSANGSQITSRADGS